MPYRPQTRPLKVIDCFAYGIKKMWELYLSTHPTSGGSCMPWTVERASIEPTLTWYTFLRHNAGHDSIITSCEHLPLAVSMTVQKSLQDFHLSRTKRQSKRLLICRGSHGVAARPDVAALHWTLRVGGKDTNNSPNRQAIRSKFLIYLVFTDCRRGLRSVLNDIKSKEMRGTGYGVYNNVKNYAIGSNYSHNGCQ